jgi:hypothetical protein
MMNRNGQRGSALLTSIVVLLVVTLISLGILRFTARELAGATAAGHEQALVACAETARKLLVSQFHALGLQPTSIDPLNVDLGANTRVLGGHYDTAGTPGVEIGQVTYLPATAFGPNDNVRDLTNIVSGPFGQGGRPVKVVVHCQQGGAASDAASGRQLEVEFGVRFGL